MSTTLGILECGTDVTVGFHNELPMDSYNISLPLSGYQELSLNGGFFMSDSDTGIVVSPGNSQELAISGNCRRLHVAIRRHAMHQLLESMLQSVAAEPLVFCPTIDAAKGGQGSWWRLVRHMLQELDGPTAALFSTPLFAGELEKAIIKGLILSQPSNYSEKLAEALEGKLPHYLLKAKAFIHANAKEALCVEDIVSASGVSRDKLFEIFKAYFGTSPMAYLKKYRLEMVREALVTDRSRSNISSLAEDWGFPHLGRFSIDYRELFGESPSQTVKRHIGKFPS